MSFPFSLDIRRIIPRWRDSRVAIATGELALPVMGKKQPIDDRFIRERRELWETNREIEFASELVASALSYDLPDIAIDAAEYILENATKATPTVVAIAEELLIRSGHKSANSRLESTPEIVHPETLHSRIHNIRNSLFQYPRNALMWVDLAQAYAILGQLHKSDDSMKKALYLAPNNRFVLRSAARLFIHLDKANLAHKILSERPVTKQDPWLLAAEIATATVAGRTSNLIKQSRYIIEAKNHSPYDLAELASALGTLELSDGSSRKAKKLFQTSLISPTENSVAQSVWAKQWINALEIEDAIKLTPRTYEAQTWNSFLLLDWDHVIGAAKIWLADEPYSSRPAIFGSYAASVGLEDFATSEDFSRIGLNANPTDHNLINNLAFSLAKQNRPSEAADWIRKISGRPAPTITIEIAIRATEGLIAFRMDDISGGKAKYTYAIELARKNSLSKIQALASIHYAEEMLRAGKWDLSATISFVKEATKRVTGPDIDAMLKRVMKRLK